MGSKKAFRALLALAGVALCVVLAATSSRTAAALGPAVAAWASAHTGLAVTLGRLEVHALPPEVVLTDVAASAAGAGVSSLALHIRQMRLRPAWLASLSGEPTLALLAIEGLRGGAQLGWLRQQLLRPAPAPADHPAPHLPIDVERLSLVDVDLTVTDGPRELTCWGLQGQLAPAGWHRRAWQLRLVGAALREPALQQGTPLALEFSAQGSVVGGLHRPRRIDIAQAALRGPGAALAAVGTWRLDAPQASMVTATLDASLGQVGAWLAPVAAWQGDLHAVLRARAPLADTDGDLLLQLQNFGRARGEPLGDVVVEADGSRRTATLQRLRWQRRGQDLLTASGRMDAAPPYAFDVVAELANAPLADAWAALSGHPSPWGGLLGGHVAAAGVLVGPLEVHSSLDVTAEGLTLQRPSPGARRILALPALRALGSLHTLRAVTTSQNLQLHAHESLLLVDGALHHAAGSAGPSLALRLWAGGFKLADLGPIAGVPYAGTAGLGGTLFGPIARPEVQGHARVEGLRIGRFALGDAEATVHFVAPVLHLHQLAVARARGDASGEAHVAFVAPQPRLLTKLALHGVDAAQMLTTLGLGAGQVASLDARLFGSVAIDGPLAQPEGEALLTLPALRVAGASLGPATLKLRFTAGAQRLAAALSASPSTGTLGGHLFVSQDYALQFDLMGRGLPLGLLPGLPRGQAQGEVAIQLNAALHHGPPQGSLVLDVQDFVLRGQPQGGAHLVARAQNGALNVALSMLQGSIHAEGDVALAPGYLGQLRGRFDGLDLVALAPLVGDAPQGADPWASLTATGSGHWQLTGPLARPNQLQLTGAVTALSLAWGTVGVRLRGPTQVRYRDQQLQLSPMRLTGPLLDLQLQGAVPIDPRLPELGLSLTARGDLAALHALVADVETGHGPFTLTGTLRGSWARPRILGDAHVHGGSLRWRGQDRPVEHIEAEAAFTGRTAAITRASATLGEGRLTLVGEANVGAGTWADPKGPMSLRLGLRRVPWHPAADVETTLSGNLELTGGSAEGALRGEVVLGALRYTARIDLDKLVAKRAAVPLRAPSGLSGRPLRLGVHVTAPGNIIVSSPVLEAELAADVTVTGTSQRVGVVGHVTPLWARAHWRDNLFVLTRSSIDFVDEYRVAPQFNVVARTHACQMDADVQIQGGVDGFVVTPTGRDERGIVDPQDVLACLQLGLRLRDFDGNQKSGATAGAVSSGLDALWTVSGLDAKVRKILPIAVDELRLTSSWSSIAQRTTPRVLVAKELGHHVALRYARSIDEYNDQSFSLDYRVIDHLSLSAGWLTARDVAIGDLGVDGRLHWELQ